MEAQVSSICANFTMMQRWSPATFGDLLVLGAISTADRHRLHAAGRVGASTAAALLDSSTNADILLGSRNEVGGITPAWLSASLFGVQGDTHL